MRIGVRISEFFMHAWVIFLNKYLCMLIMIPGECTDPLNVSFNEVVTAEIAEKIVLKLHNLIPSFKRLLILDG